MNLTDVTQLEPREAAAKLAAMQQEHSRWLDEFAEYLDQHRAGRSLAHTLTVWNINQSQAGRLFGVSRQAISKWLSHGAPAERAKALANIAAATDLLLHYLKRDRIPAVVRRPVPALGQSLLDLIASDETELLLQTCRDMFDFNQLQH